MLFLTVCVNITHFYLYFLVFNDGSDRELLNLDGTIPVRYKGEPVFSAFIAGAHSGLRFDSVLPTPGTTKITLLSCFLSFGECIFFF